MHFKHFLVSLLVTIYNNGSKSTVVKLMFFRWNIHQFVRTCKLYCKVTTMHTKVEAFGVNVGSSLHLPVC